MSSDASILTGLRVMVVEDEMLVSLLIEAMLTDHECSIVGPFATVKAAVEAAMTEAIDGPAGRERRRQQGLSGSQCVGDASYSVSVSVGLRQERHSPGPAGMACLHKTLPGG
jgi:hypothetical protein